MNNILIVRYGEVALKGMNKPWFERILEGRVVKSLNGAGALRVERREGLIIVSGFETKGDGSSVPAGTDEPSPFVPGEDRLMGEAVKRVSRVFGVASVSPAVRIESRDLPDICAAAVEYMKDTIAHGNGARESGGRSPGAGPVTFKIYAKRSDKRYPITSPELAAKVGEAVLNAFAPAVKVDVKNPGVLLTVHLRQGEVFLYDKKYDGFGGLPLGTNGKGMVLLSGGIDSPVAAWLMAKRGMRVEAVHYHSYPYTSERALEKVRELAVILASYCGRFRMHIVNLLPAQEAIAQLCPEAYMTILVRRFMMRVAERIARTEDCNMLVTGESLGQVASQTAESIFATDAVAGIPVMRPLIALDKTDIIDRAREIETYEKSIEPYEDCCTVFLPKHPVTRPRLAEVAAAESAIPEMDELISGLLENKKTIVVRPDL